MSPSFIFRIDEIKEAEDAMHHADAYNTWIPSTEPRANIRVGGGISYQYWVCDGQRINELQQVPQGCTLYKVFSVYFHSGFWVLAGDATNPGASSPWRRLNFDHENNFTSFLSNAGQHDRMAAQHPNQRWPKMLLPDIYHAPTQMAQQSYGGLVGELPIFLALMAFSVQPHEVAWALSNHFTAGSWRTHERPNGWNSQRGVVVYVYQWHGNSNELRSFEHGHLGKYFNNN